jgi:AcrR family transcriptional regulator
LEPEFGTTSGGHRTSRQDQTMTLPPRIRRACDEMRAHLAQFDLTAMSNGRRQILAAFLNLALKEGFPSVTMRGLAKALDVKASSIYFHFPGGKDEIIGETLRWHYYNWGTAVLERTVASQNVQEFWEELVRVHVERQIEVPDSDLWDILVAMDRVYGFLRPDFQSEIRNWLDLSTELYAAAAREMGYDVDTDVARAIVKLLDSVTSWCDLDGTGNDSEQCVTRAIVMTRALLSSESQETRSKSKPQGPRNSISV